MLTTPSTLTGATWRRPNGACNGVSPEPATTRRYTVYTYSITTPGTYTVSPMPASAAACASARP